MTDKIQLYSIATPNGQKVSIALEEMQLAYDAHTIDIRKGDQFTPEFMAINPNSKIPAIVDPKGPNGSPINLFESGAILLYLAEKTNKFIPSNPKSRWETIQWLFFQMAGVGPMFGQFGHFYKYAKDKCDDPYPLERYTKEVIRLLTVLDVQLSKNEYLTTSEYTIADIATFPWVLALDKAYDAQHFLHVDEFLNVARWVNLCMARKAVQQGLLVCPFS